MSDLFRKLPFFESHEFLGTLVKGEKRAAKLQMIVEYPLTKQGPIRGQVWGRRETSNKLDDVFHERGPYLTLTTVKTDRVGVDVSSSKALMGRLTWSHWPAEYGDEMSYLVAELSFDELKILRRLGPSGRIDRSLTFYLVGPSRMWDVHESRETSYTGNVKVNVKNSAIELAEKFPFSIEVTPSYIYDQSSGPENHEMVRRILTLDFHTNEPAETLTEEEFVSAARLVTDDLTLLISMISKKWVTWYRYDLVTTDRIQSYVRTTRECSSDEPDHKSTLVESHKSREFLKVAFTNLTRLRSKGINLFMPILYYVAGNEARYLEERFAALFWSLERFRNLIASEEPNLCQILPKKDFSELQNTICELIEQELKDVNCRKRVLRKIPELNRPAFRDVLNALLESFGVDWSGIYPPSSKVKLVNVRHELFHSSPGLNPEELFKEYSRLKAVVERLLLSVLGWKDFSRAPNRYMRDWLTSQTDES